MKKKIDILHVYAGTSGSAGLYLNEIYIALSQKFSQEAIVSYNFNFNYGKRWFYKYSDLSSFNFFTKVSIIRYFIRYLELVMTLIKIYVFLSRNCIKLINYSLTSDLSIELFFLRLIKQKKSLTLMITCHDVLPFGIDEQIFLKKKIVKKSKFFNLADYLLIHNENSRRDLIDYYNISTNVIKIPFPIMDLNHLRIPNVYFQIKTNPVKLRFGMFGHFRPEKGLDILIEAWKLFYCKKKDVELIIAGNIPKNQKYDFNGIKYKSTVVVKRFLEDSVLKNLMSKCDVIILPYKRGTNSGLPSSILSCGAIVLSSDIPMFLNNELILKNYFFKKEDPIDLCSKLEWIYSLSKESLIGYKEENKRLLMSYKNSFTKETVITFEYIFKTKEKSDKI